MMLVPPTHSRSFFRGWILFFCGVCMGAADLVPGISGGTIAFILGFYQPLLESLQTLNWPNFQLLFKGKVQEFFQKVAWKFLLTLLAGILCAFISLANFFQFMLSDEVYRIYFYATFLGLILASFIFCIRKVTVWKGKMILGLCLGALAAYLLTDSTLTPVSESSCCSTFFNGWLVVCGALAICALLLPGISGSYILTLLNVYPIVIESLVEFLNGLTHNSFNVEAFAVLWSLGLGIVLGALGFARALSWLLRHYPNQSLALLSGFMIGGIRSVWPFWSSESIVMPLKLYKGPQFVTLQPFIPSWESPLAWQASLCALAGFILVFALEAIVKRKQLQWLHSHL
jgi:putative membrane protein